MKFLGIDIFGNKKKQIKLNDVELKFLQSHAQKLGFNFSVYSQTSDTYIQKGFLYNIYVFSVIHYIITTASSIKVKLFKKLSDDRIKEIYNHEILDLYENPNQLQSKIEFVENFLGWYLLNGNSYLFSENKYEAYILPSSQVSTKKKDYFTVENYQVFGKTIDKENIIHTKTFNPTDPTAGLSFLHSATSTIQSQNAGLEALAKSYENSGVMGVLSNASTEPEKNLSPEQLEQIKQKFKEEFTGIDNWSKILITNQSFNWQKLGLSPVDLAILDSLKFSQDNICNVFKFPSLLFNNDSSSYNNRSEAKKSLYNDCVIPFFKLYLNSFNKLIQKYYDNTYYLDIDYNSIDALNEDKKDKAAWLKDAFWLSVNERRIEMNYEEITGGDIYVLSNNTILDNQFNIIQAGNNTPQQNQ